MQRPVIILLLVFGSIKLLLHLLADSNSGFQGDELLHIQTGHHLDAGYAEFPPMIGLLAWVQNQFGSASVFVHHLFAHLAALLIMYYAVRITLELGGGPRAVFIVLLCILIAPGLGRSQQLFQPVVFSQFFWILGFYQLTRYVKYSQRRYLAYLAVTVAFGLLTKYDILFFAAGLVALFFYAATRQALIRHRFWISALLALLILLPNIVWQVYHSFPVWEMMQRLRETQLDHVSFSGELAVLVLAMNPLTALVWLPAFSFLFSSPDRKLYQPLLLSVLISAALLILAQGKQYYFYPIIICLFIFGSVFWEKRILQRYPRMLYPISFILLTGALLIPFGMPVYPLHTYLEKVYPYEKKEVEGDVYGIAFQERYSWQMWPEVLTALKEVYDSLPGEEKPPCIWGKHYRQAGAIQLSGKEYGLPRAFSYHGSFYYWAPRKGPMPKTLIALAADDTGADFFEPFYESVTPVKKIYNPYSDDRSELWQTIYICKGPRYGFMKMKELFRKRIFE